LLHVLLAGSFAPNRPSQPLRFQFTTSLSFALLSLVFHPLSVPLAAWMFLLTLLQDSINKKDDKENRPDVNSGITLWAARTPIFFGAREALFRLIFLLRLASK
jgi:hypothetical protein